MTPLLKLLSLSLANEMLDKLAEYGPEAWEPGKTFLDPACGNGGLLAPVLERKMSLGHDPVEALSCLYGCDIMRDNIRECRLRLLKIVRDSGVEIAVKHVRTVFNQIVLTAPPSYPNGSLDYDFTFPNKASGKDVAKWMEGIKSGWLDDPEAASQADSEIEEALADDFFNL